MGGVAANSELRAALPEAAAGAASALHGQRRDDRLRGPLHGPHPIPGVPFARCTCLGVAPSGFSSSRCSRSCWSRPSRPAGRDGTVALVDRQLARPRRRAARGGAERAALDRRPADAVGRAAAREGEVRDRGAGALLDDSGLRGAAAGADDARRRRASPFAASSATPACSTASRRRSTRARSRCSSTCRRWWASTRCAPRSRPSESESLLSSARFGAVERSPRGRRPAGLRRPRRHDRAARHGRRPGASVPARQDPAGDRPRRPQRRRRRALEPAGSVAGRAARHRARRACSSAPAARAGCTASRRARRCCRSGSQAGSRPPTAAARLRAQRPADRRARPCGRPERRRRRSRRGARRARRRRRAVRRLHRQPRGAAVAGRARPRTRSSSHRPATTARAGPLFGSIAGPAGGAGALAVGATDDAAAGRRGARRAAPRPRRDPRPALPLLGAGRAGARDDAGGRDARARPAGSPVPRARLLRPRGLQPRCRPGRRRARRGRIRQGLAARRVACGRARGRPVRRALPPGLAAGRRGRARDPVVVVPAAAARRAACRASARATTSAIARRRSARRHEHDASAASPAFSSRGLAFGGSVKPDVAAPGIALATVGAGHGVPTARRSTARSTARAARPRPSRAAPRCSRRCGPALDGAGLRSLLVGYAQRGRASALAVGNGIFRLGAAAVGEVATSPATLGFGAWGGPRWHATRTFVDPERLDAAARASRSRPTSTASSEALQFTVQPSALRAPQRPASRKVAGDRAGVRPRRASGSSRARSRPPSPAACRRCACRGRSGSRRYSANLLAHVSLNKKSFAPSDTAPGAADVQAGKLVRGRRSADSARRAARRAALRLAAAGSSARSRGCATCCPARTASGSRAAARRARAAARRLRAAARRVADAAARRQAEQGASPLPDRVDSAGDGHGCARVAPAREPVRARAASCRRSPTRSASTTPRRRPRRSARRRSRSRSRRRWTTAPCASSPATASRTTSRAARRRAASATTRTSRSTRSRRSRCG